MVNVGDSKCRNMATTAQFYLLGDKEDQWPFMRNINGFFQKKADAVVYASFGHVDMSVDASIFEKTGGRWAMFGEALAEGICKELASEDSPYMVDASNILVGQHDMMRRLPKIDICKLDAKDANRMILFDIMDAGYRPSLILVRFTESPDAHVPTQLAAGHLQNCGYALMGVHEDKYLYYFVDNCLYDYCSWVQPGIENPLVAEFKQAIKK